MLFFASRRQPCDFDGVSDAALLAQVEVATDGVGFGAWSGESAIVVRAHALGLDSGELSIPISTSVEAHGVLAVAQRQIHKRLEFE